MVKPAGFFSLLTGSILTLTSIMSEGQIVINEVCSSNSTVIADEDSSHPDWIELYNAGPSAVNLVNYALSDDALTPRKWVLPNYILAPSAHVIIFASDKNRKVSVNHWETAIYDNDTWKYLVPTSEPPSSWRTPGFNDSGWPSGMGGFGNGDGDDNTVLASPLQSVFIRKTFTVADKSKISAAVLHIDYDDGYTAFLNGRQIGYANMAEGIRAFNEMATANREATIYQGGAPETQMINADTLAAALVNGTNVLCIQVHNTSTASSDLTARAFLSLGITDASSFYGAVPSWFNVGAVLALHTNFKLGDGDQITLVDGASTVLDQYTLPETQMDHSMGRKPDGSAIWQVFTQPTPGSTNNAATSFSGYCQDPLTFSVNAGFYGSSKNVTISGSSQIRYTLDGSEPTPSSTLYSGAVAINSTKVLRAGCFTGGKTPLKTYSNTYFIGENIDLPVFSISVNPETFFDPQTGIYMLGPDADSANLPHFGANYWEETEVPVHVEFFENDGSLKLEQDAGCRIYGNWSRANAQKSLALKAGDKYGDDDFDYKFFPSKNIDKFEHLVLRNSGGDFNVMQYRDGFIQKSVSKKTAIDIQDYRASVVFINGQYWGVLNMREKINENYVESNHGVDKDSIDLSETWAQTLEGTNNIALMEWIATNYDMSQANNYKMVADSFDIDNMIDYFATEIFISNWDWPQNNVKLWRPVKGNRKWRYILWDTDISYGLYNLQNYDYNQLARVVNATPWSIGPHADIFGALLNNTAFRNKFVNRYADMMNTLLKPATLNTLLYDMRDTIADEMPKHFARWGSWNDWNVEIDKTKTFYTNRITYARNEVKNEFGLVKQVNITLNVQPAGAGVIKINSIYPEDLPWTGVYFDGVPVQITAIPNPGYTFNNWTSNNLITTPNSNKSVTINVTTNNETFTAHFSGSSAPTKIAITEINYNSALAMNAGDWFEIHNYGNASVDLSGWYIKDYEEYHKYVLPANTILAAGARLVVCSDTAKFKTRHPGVTNYIGNIGFAFSNTFDMIRLYDYKQDLQVSAYFKGDVPWPLQANGLGYTLELTANNADPSQSGSWFTGCEEGTPGYAYHSSCIMAVEDNIVNDESKIKLYPNPARSKLSVETGDFMFSEIKLMNSQGTEVRRIQGLHTMDTQLDITGLPGGLYTIIVNNDDTGYSEKLIILE